MTGPWFPCGMGYRIFFKGTFTTAAVKLHLAVDLVTGALTWYDLTSGATHDSQRFPAIRSRCLYIFDLGYWSLDLFHRIQAQKGFFLSRLKGNANLTITKVVFGQISKRRVGSDLRKTPILQKCGNTVELCALLFNKNIRLDVRVVGYWNSQEKNITGTSQI